MKSAERKQFRGNDGCLKLCALAVGTDPLAILMTAALPMGATIYLHALLEIAASMAAGISS